jgi:hypothetical protein
MPLSKRQRYLASCIRSDTAYRHHLAIMRLLASIHP